MVELTKAEEQLMQYLWKLGEGTVQEVMALMDDGKRPSRTTVSTVIRLLEEKGAVGHKPSQGRGYIYYPLLKKEEYSNKHLKDFISRYFDNSFSSLVSFFVKENNLSMQELDEMLEEIKKGSEK
jgi:predicted transcriptional regulator